MFMGAVYPEEGDFLKVGFSRRFDKSGKFYLK